MVDRLDVEVQQCMELTSTNRSCGLTTYISHARAVTGSGVGESNAWLGRAGQAMTVPTGIVFESRREKVKAIYNHPIRDLIVSCGVGRSAL